MNNVWLQLQQQFPHGADLAEGRRGLAVYGHEDVTGALAA